MHVHLIFWHLYVALMFYTKLQLLQILCFFKHRWWTHFYVDLGFEMYVYYRDGIHMDDYYRDEWYLILVSCVEDHEPLICFYWISIVDLGMELVLVYDVLKFITVDSLTYL